MGEGERNESKVVYNDGSRTRAIRGRVVGESEDGLFLILQRRDGQIQIAKSAILKIERGRP